MYMELPVESVMEYMYSQRNGSFNQDVHTPFCGKMLDIPQLHVVTKESSLDIDAHSSANRGYSLTGKVVYERRQRKTI